MPINIDPTEITIETVATQTVTADKLHIIALKILDPTKEKPNIELNLLPYGEAADGSRQFGTGIMTLRTADLYAAIANMAAAGYTKMAGAMEAVFDAAAEMVKYAGERKADAEAARRAATDATAAYNAAMAQTPDEPKPDLLKAMQDANNAAMKAAAAYADPANPR